MKNVGNIKAGIRNLLDVELQDLFNFIGEKVVLATLQLFVLIVTKVIFNLQQTLN